MHERIEVLDILRAKIGGCFGDIDGVFMSHKLDEDFAKNLRELAFNRGVSLKEIQNILLEYLTSKDYNSLHIDKQMVNANIFFAKRLR